MGVTIKEAQLVEELKGNDKLPISDGSNIPKSVSIEQIKEFANKDIDIPTKVSELENDSDYATSKEVEDAISKIPTPDVGGQISAALLDYVKKVEGKGLSTNDFTNELKEKLEGITPYDPSELEGEIGKLETALNTLVGGNASNAIESFNEIVKFLENVSDQESLSGIIAGINTRIAEVEAKIPTKVSELENDKNYLTEHQSLSHLATKDELNAKQDKIEDLDAIRQGASRAIPTKTSELTNDSGFLTEHQDISHLVSHSDIQGMEESVEQAKEFSVEAKENADIALSKSIEAKNNSTEALRQAEVATSAIATLKGLENSDEVMAEIAKEIVQIAQNKSDIANIKQSTIYLTQAEYNELVTNGAILDNVEYNIFE